MVTIVNRGALEEPWIIPRFDRSVRLSGLQRSDTLLQAANRSAKWAKCQKCSFCLSRRTNAINCWPYANRWEREESSAPMETETRRRKTSPACYTSTLWLTSRSNKTYSLCRKISKWYWNVATSDLRKSLLFKWAIYWWRSWWCYFLQQDRSWCVSITWTWWRFSVSWCRWWTPFACSLCRATQTSR